MAAAELAIRVDHIGSTSVAGLPAKDVIDLQVTVASMADADALAEPLAAAGFPKLPHIDHDMPKPYAPDIEQWRKRLHAAADPGRLANVHLRVEGSPGWRFALLLPDWLRANPADRDDYLAVKRKLTLQFEADDTTDNYAEAKEAWFAAAGPRAEEWAERTGWRPAHTQ